MAEKLVRIEERQTRTAGAAAVGREFVRVLEVPESQVNGRIIVEAEPHDWKEVN